MKNLLTCLSLLLFLANANAQAPTWSEHILPILQKNCAPCHRPNGGAPFPLLTCEDASARATFIAHLAAQRIMPPWYADPGFRTFHNQRILTDAEIETLRLWAEAGAPCGKRKKKAKISEAAFAQKFPAPDLTLRMTKEFTIPGDNSEQFRIFVIPTEVEKERFVRGIEFRPGNLQMAHHARLMLDTTGLLRPDDGVVAGDSNTELTRRNVILNDYFWQGWLPGTFGVFYPEGFAKRLPQNADIVLNMHYSPSPVEAKDRSEVRIWYAEKPPERLIKTFVLDENSVVNQPFVLPANVVTTFYMRSEPLPKSVSLFSVLPHAHLLCRSFKAYAITERGEAIFLVKIDRWNFNWQMTYQFENLLKLPKGAVIFAEATYDNTAANHRNPHIPPQLVQYGWGSKNEMMNLILEYVDYREGDEQIILFEK